MSPVGAAGLASQPSLDQVLTGQEDLIFPRRDLGIFCSLRTKESVSLIRHDIADKLFPPKRYL
jgi:hypothetical protein